MNYRDFLERDRSEQILLGVPGHDPASNAERQRRAEEIIAEHTADVDRAYKEAPAMVEPWAPQAPFGTYALARNGGDVRAALNGEHDIELSGHIAEAMHFPEDHRVAGQELERTKERVLARMDEPGQHAPSAQHVANVQSVQQDAALVQAQTSQMPGGDADAAVAQQSADQATASVTAAQSAVAARPRAGATASAPVSQQQRQRAAGAATLAAREHVSTDRIREDVQQDAAARQMRDDRRDYPQMSERSAQQDRRLGRSQ